MLNIFTGIVINMQRMAAPAWRSGPYSRVHAHRRRVHFNADFNEAHQVLWMLLQVSRDRDAARPLREAPRLRLPDHRVRPSKSASTPPPKSRLPRFAGRPTQHKPFQPQSSGSSMLQSSSQPSSRGPTSRQQDGPRPRATRSRSTSKPPPYPTHPARSRQDRAQPEADLYPSAKPASTPSAAAAATPAKQFLHADYQSRISPNAPPPSPPHKHLSPIPRFNQLRDMHDDLTLDAELDLDLDEELRGMSFLRTPHSRIRTRSLSLLSPQYSLSPSTSPSALRNLSPPKQQPLMSHRSLPKSLSSPVARALPHFPPPPSLSPQHSLSPQKYPSRQNSLSSQCHSSPRPSLTSQLTGTSPAGTLPHSPASSARSGSMPVPLAAAPARMPCPATHIADIPALQTRLSPEHLSTRHLGPGPDAAPALRSSAPTSLMTATTQRSLALHGTDSDASGELPLDSSLRAPLSCQGASRRSAGTHDDVQVSAVFTPVDGESPHCFSLGSSSPAQVSVAQVSPQLSGRSARDAALGMGQRQLPGYESSDAESNSGSDDDCSIATLTLTPALAAECSELVRALAAEQGR